MNIAKDTAVTIAYRMTSPAGKPLDSGTTAYLHGGYDNLFAKVEAALEGQGVGHQVALELSAAEAFGERDEALVRTIPRSEFPPGVKVGGQLQGAGPTGAPQVYSVVKIKGPEVHLDGNHPLAGQALRFSATVKAVRAATAEEIAHGHVHGAHDHQH
jgi:FKBP-type peptidyl-prolyl cis-trans isomerase SlyD